MLELTDYPDTGQLRIYDIEAISLPIVYNKYGDHDPNGLMYVLKQDSARIRQRQESYLICLCRSPVRRFSLWSFGQMSAIRCRSILKTN